MSSHTMTKRSRTEVISTSAVTAVLGGLAAWAQTGSVVAAIVIAIPAALAAGGLVANIPAE